MLTLHWRSCQALGFYITGRATWKAAIISGGALHLCGSTGAAPGGAGSGSKPPGDPWPTRLAFSDQPSWLLEGEGAGGRAPWQSPGCCHNIYGKPRMRTTRRDGDLCRRAQSGSSVKEP